METQIIAELQTAKRTSDRLKKITLLKKAKALLDIYLTKLTKKDLS